MKKGHPTSAETCAEIPSAKALSEKQVRFLWAYAKSGNVKFSAKEAGVTHECHYRWLERNAEYAAEFNRYLVADEDGLTGEQNTFLTAYRETGTVSAAAKACGISDRQHRRWLDGSEAYTQAFQDAMQFVGDGYENNVRNLASGAKSENVRMCSNFFLVKGFKPQFRDNAAANINVGVTVTPVKVLSGFDQDATLGVKQIESRIVPALPEPQAELTISEAKSVKELS